MNPKNKASLVACYDLRSGKGEGLFWFRCFINFSLTYLLRHLPTYLQTQDAHGAFSSGISVGKNEGGNSYLRFQNMISSSPLLTELRRYVQLNTE